MTIFARSIHERGDHIYITAPVQLYEPEAKEIETFAFAQSLKTSAPNPKIMWMRGQYVEADEPNTNADEWTEGELSIKALTPVLMPVTVMHDLRSAVGTIADARLLTPQADNVPRARIDTTLAIWAHRFPEIAAECSVNAGQGTLMQSMECLSPYYECTTCGEMMRRTPDWQAEWRAHVVSHADSVASAGRSPARRLLHVTFTGVGLIFGTRGAKGAMPSAHLEVEELAAMHRAAHEGKSSKPRRKNTVDIDDTKYEALVAAKAEGESKVTDLTAQVAERDRKIEALEADKVKAQEERDSEKKRADTAEEKSRVTAMKDERLSALGTGFRAKLDKLETTAKRVVEQAGSLSDEEWEARLVELEETLGTDGTPLKRDTKLDAPATPPAGGGSNGGGGGGNDDHTAGLLFDKSTVASSAVSTGTGSTEVTASGGGTATEPTPERRQSVMGGLIRKPKAGAKA